MEMSEKYVCKLATMDAMGQPFEISYRIFSQFISSFSWELKKIYTKFTKVKKLMGQIQRENVGGLEEFLL